MSGLPNPKDDSLLRQWRRGSEDAARILYERYRPRVAGLVQAKLSAELANRVDTDDLVQSIFRRFFQSATDKEYRAMESDELWGLFLVIAINRIRTEETFQRAQRRDVRRTVHLELVRYLTSAQIPQSEETSHVLQMTIEEILSRLPAQHRTIIELRIEGHDVPSIAEQVGRSSRSVERCLQSVRQHLRKHLSDTE